MSGPSRELPRWVDIGAIEFIHRKIVALRDEGCAVLLVSAELEEVTALSDRLLVIHKGAIAGEVDPKKTSNENLLRFFWRIHDPTTLNRQGNDVGTQYRSAIFYHSPEQKAAAEAVMARLAKEAIFGGRKIVTELAPAATFYPAETYHQRYFERVGAANPYCTYVIEPKVAKFRKHYMDRLKRASKEAQ